MWLIKILNPCLQHIVILDKFLRKKVVTMKVGKIILIVYDLIQVVSLILV